MLHIQGLIKEIATNGGLAGSTVHPPAQADENKWPPLSSILDIIPDASVTDCEDQEGIRN